MVRMVSSIWHSLVKMVKMVNVQGEGWYLTGVATRLMLNLGIIVVDEG